MKILIIDDQVLFRDGLTILLESQPEFEVVGQVNTISDGMLLISKRKPDLILINLNLPDGSGLAATQKIVNRWPEINVVILSVHESDDLALSAIQHGAVGFIPKHMAKAHFLRSITGIQQGEAAITRRLSRLLMQEYVRICKVKPVEVDKSMESLTFREMEIFRMMSSGASNREIADDLNIAENTVKSHVHKIFEKLNLRSRAEVRNFAQRIQRGSNGHIKKALRRT